MKFIVKIFVHVYNSFLTGKLSLVVTLVGAQGVPPPLYHSDINNLYSFFLAYV